jgi:hypothetical protein
MRHSEELQNDFYEIEPGRAKTVIKDLLLCAELAIAGSDDPADEGIDAEYVPPTGTRKLWGLRVYGYFLAFAPPTADWQPPDPTRASLRCTLVLRCLSAPRSQINSL